MTEIKGGSVMSRVLLISVFFVVLILPFQAIAGEYTERFSISDISNGVKAEKPVLLAQNIIPANGSPPQAIPREQAKPPANNGKFNGKHAKQHVAPKPPPFRTDNNKIYPINRIFSDGYKRFRITGDIQSGVQRLGIVECQGYGGNCRVERDDNLTAYIKNTLKGEGEAFKVVK